MTENVRKTRPGAKGGAWWFCLESYRFVSPRGLREHLSFILNFPRSAFIYWQQVREGRRLDKLGIDHRGAATGEGRTVHEELVSKGAVFVGELDVEGMRNAPSCPDCSGPMTPEEVEGRYCISCGGSHDDVECEER